jgi:hypothetical protein
MRSNLTTCDKDGKLLAIKDWKGCYLERKENPGNQYRYSTLVRLYHGLYKIDIQVSGDNSTLFKAFLNRLRKTLLNDTRRQSGNTGMDLGEIPRPLFFSPQFAVKF